MPDDRRRTLLRLLLSAVALVAAAVACSLGLDRLADARRRVQGLEARIEAARRSIASAGADEDDAAFLEGEIAELRSRRYRPGEMSPYRFGTLVRQRLAHHGIAVQRYAVIEDAGSTAMEFSVRAGAGSLLAFLEEVSSSRTSWSIPSLHATVDGESDRIEAVFRIAYEMAEESPR